MNINYLGLNCFRLQDSGVSVLIGPYDQATGLHLPRMQNDLTLYSNPAEADFKKDSSFVIGAPGEYEVKGVFVYGIEQAKNNLIYLMEMEGIKIVHLGSLAPGKLSQKQLERLEGLDVLLVPVGGGGSLNAKQAAELVSDLEPRLVIPMFYQMSGLKQKLETLDAFKKEMGGKFETVDKLKISKKDLPEEDTRYVIIEPSL